MIQIKTVTGWLSQAEGFDQQVNRWLEEGWRLDDIPAIREGYLIAVLKKETPEPAISRASAKKIQGRPVA